MEPRSRWYSCERKVSSSCGCCLRSKGSDLPADACIQVRRIARMSDGSMQCHREYPCTSWWTVLLYQAALKAPTAVFPLQRCTARCCSGLQSLPCGAETAARPAQLPQLCSLAGVELSHSSPASGLKRRGARQAGDASLHPTLAALTTPCTRRSPPPPLRAGRLRYEYAFPSTTGFWNRTSRVLHGA